MQGQYTAHGRVAAKTQPQLQKLSWRHTVSMNERAETRAQSEEVNAAPSARAMPWPWTACGSDVSGLRPGDVDRLQRGGAGARSRPPGPSTFMRSPG